MPFIHIAVLFAVTAGHLPWVENNYPQALAEARSRHVPLFVEVWAPW